MNRIRYQKLVVALTAISLSSFALAQSELENCDSIKLESDGNLTDKSSSLTWQRCQLGQSVNSGICSGEPEKMTWQKAHETAARQAATQRVDWIIPTKDQLDQLLRKCGDAPIKDTWTSTPDTSGPSYAWKVSGNGQSLTLSHIDQLAAIRLVRRSKFSDVQTFKGNLSRLGLSAMLSGVIYPAEADEATRLQKQATAEKREADAQRRRDAAIAAEAQRERNALFNKKADPKLLYLKAGKFERDGDSEKAKELYEFITDNFANTDWAVKANDRLLSGGNTRNSGQGGNRKSGTGNSCAKYYSGYSGRFEFVIREGGRTIWGEKLDQHRYGQFLVVGSGNDQVTIKGTDSGNFPGYNQHEQMSCDKLAELERTREIKP